MLAQGTLWGWFVVTLALCPCGHCFTLLARTHYPVVRDTLVVQDSVWHFVLWSSLCYTSAVLNSKGPSVTFSTQCYLDGTLSYLLFFPVTNDCYKVLLICAVRFGELQRWQRDGDTELGKVVSFVQTMHSGNSTQDEFQFSISSILSFLRHYWHSILFK